MRVWHHGVGPIANTVNGVDQTVWALGEEQARRGHCVTFLTSATADQQSDALNIGIHLAPRSEAPAPDVIHMHSVFIPAQMQLAAWARRQSVPYVVSPHGGLARHDLARGRLKKGLYSAALERPRFRRAAVAVAVSDGERSEIRAFLRRDTPPIVVVGNAMHPAPACSAVPLVPCEDIVFLGRFDTFLKGLDRLATVATFLPDMRIGLYGTPTRTALPQLPPNVVVHAPVHGLNKWSVLRSAAAYIQLSRWEAFGLSVLEAALVGTPPIVAPEMTLAPLIEEWGGLVIDIDRPHEARSRIRDLIELRSDRRPMISMMEKAALFVRADLVADRVDAVYSLARSVR